MRPGRIGLVAASGTGAQQVMSLLDEAGAGVSHVLGVGGRDLSAEISGRSTLQALRALDADPATELIVVVSKPPAPEVGDLIRSAARRLATPVRFGLLGEGGDDLTTVVEDALGAVGVAGARLAVLASRPAGPVARGRARSAACSPGGTLCEEAAIVAGSAPHEMTDFGDDRYTRGRAHPMIDPTLRLERLAAEAAGGACAAVLIDVVLGHGAEPDPARGPGPGDREGGGTDGIPVVVSLCGTSGDPQGRDRQAEALAAAGAAVFASNAAATRHAVSLAEGSDHALEPGANGDRRRRLGGLLTRDVEGRRGRGLRAGRRPRRAGRAGGDGRLAATGRPRTTLAPRGRPRHGHGRPAARRGERRGRRPDARRPAAPGRRTARARGPRPRARLVPARRARR